ncbi:Protein of unknown function DUF1234 [Sulfurimonas denitrificans DSM 1251]|jgi:predicted alpha/beta hydrolase family esterase|uniref:Serine hydrolase family protein n=1 Tax=Sulfurimonas denitrificans (strain ATCC 33889 / DSM 1251) TaxID=326298 RepID=Q30UA6_SULDN|nr:alpha/beta hydrolase [Sulfurimonas denitrificans]ABB43425.1 Protein of unknown function DUF1234 [Sulfurimonas denitrificans DSM 1251]MDD3442897.1 alpha/beta hydrolase [Sulfurimonas denitrificans]
MRRVLILHGWGGSDFPHWQSWLSSEIAKDYGCVSFLKFSDMDFPKKDVWLEELELEMQRFHPDTVLCHSLANILWFHLCNKQKMQEVEKLFLVAPPSLSCKIEELESFFPCEVPKKLYAKKTLLITSTDDPYLRQDEAQELQIALHVDMKVLQNAGHINTNSGYGEWPWLLEEIKK